MAAAAASSAGDDRVTSSRRGFAPRDLGVESRSTPRSLRAKLVRDDIPAAVTCQPVPRAARLARGDMRPVHQLVHSRTRVRPRYALLPLEGFPDSRLPTWPDAQVKVLAAPALGAQFAQYLIDLPAGKRGEFAADDAIETFYYVVSGGGKVGPAQLVRAGSFGLLPSGAALAVDTAAEAIRLIVLRKRYE